MNIFTSILLFVLYFGPAIAEGDTFLSNNVKMGQYPFMVFLYYTDDTINDSSGNRFMRTGFLIKLDWIVSSSLDLGPDGMGFPRKTLLARAGASTVDSKFTLNEDENEQEKEIILIVRPAGHNVAEPWKTDISLLKTLLPFNSSSIIGFTQLHFDHVFKEKTCTILIYAKNSTSTNDEKILMPMSVDVLDPNANCGEKFLKISMFCSADNEDSKKSLQNSEFCQGNSGGPLMCEGEVMGVQNYDSDFCQAPHLYQRVQAWQNLITCAIKEKCTTSECHDVCAMTHKDVTTVQMSDLLSPNEITEPPANVTESHLDEGNLISRRVMAPTKSPSNWLISDAAENDNNSSTSASTSSTLSIEPSVESFMEPSTESSTTTEVKEILEITTTTSTTTLKPTIKVKNSRRTKTSQIIKISKLTKIEALKQSTKKYFTSADISVDYEEFSFGNKPISSALFTVFYLLCTLIA